MVSFVFYLFYIVLINGEYELYVTSAGTLNEYCTVTKPCGSLAIALRHIENNNIINEHITIYVHGHYSQPYDSNIDCHAQIHGNISIIFDRKTIQSTNDWFPHINICYNVNKTRALYQLYGDRSSIDFHNLIYSHTSSLFIHSIDDSIGEINCYHCIFSNLYITQSNTNNFISLYHSSSFIDCLFENITIQSINNQYSVAFIAASVYIDNAVIVMDNWTVNNVITLDSNTYFISIEPHISHDITLNMSNISYTNNINSISVSRFIYANTDSKFVNSNNKISLISSSFTGSINVLYVNQGIFDVNMYDINIQTPQHIVHTQTNILYLNTIHIGQDSTVNMNNINFKTLLLCHTNDQYNGNDNTLPTIFCEIPIGFLYNAGHCYMENIKMDSSYDLSEYNLNKFSGIQYIHLTDMDLSNAYHMVGIYNDGGNIYINNILFLNGPNYQFLYNLRGTVVVNKFQTIDNTIHNNNDIWNLKPTHLFVNYGHLTVNNSYINGCTHIGFQLYYGTLHIYNSIISYLPNLIQSMYTSHSIQLYSVDISSINNPIHISSNDISITYCTFNIVSQFIFSTVGIMESDAAKLEYTQKRNIFIDHNEFQSINSLSKSSNGFIEIYSPYSMHLTRNIFGNEIYKSNITWVYVQTSMDDNCMSSNIFYDTALFIQNGSIGSCKYTNISPFINENSNQCWTSFGTPNRQYSNISVFIYTNSLISVTLNASSNLILDYIQFINYKQTPIQMIGKNNSLSIFDGLFDTNANPLQIPRYCSSTCYEIVNDNHQQIRQLRLICDTENKNILQSQANNYIGIDELAINDNTFKSVSSWSPYHIYLTSDGTYPGLYPGGKMTFDYIILDIYNNTVVDYNIFFPNDLQITLYSNELYIDNILYINTNSNVCDICMEGVEISHITIDTIGNTYFIQTYVLNDLLLVNNISINIIHCPENYIISNASKCIDPSLLPKKESRIEMSVWIVVISISLFFIIAIIIYFMCKDKAKKKDLNKQKDLSQYIRHPLVVIIGIGIYENYLNGANKTGDYIDGYFPDLPIDVDLENLSRLFRYLNYKIIGHETKLQWTHEEIMKFIEESAREACEDKYDGLIVIISSHGVKDHIVTTNMKLISFDTIHRAYSQPYPELRCKPRIFINDCCIINKQQRAQTQTDTITGNDSDNFTDNLIQIDTQSVSVQNKMNQIDGSYLLHEFGKRIISNIEQNDNNKCLGQIFDDINNYRINTGKKETENIFNSNTRYVKLCKNDQYFDNETGNDDVTMGIRSNNNHFSITRRSMKPYKPQPITHISVERVYKNNELQVTNPSVIGSDKASTMSSARRDKFIRRKNLKITHRSNSRTMSRTNSYKMVKMEDIDEDSEENYIVSPNDNINILRHQQQPEEEEKEEYVLAIKQDINIENNIQVSISMEGADEEEEDEEEEEEEAYMSNTATTNTTNTNKKPNVEVETDSSEENNTDTYNNEGTHEDLNKLVISQNVIEVTSSDSDSESVTDSYKMPLRYSPIERERHDSTQL